MEKDRAAAVRGAYLKGESYAELAERHGVPLNTMRTWLRRSLMEISLFTLFTAAWTVLPGSPLAWSLVALALFVLPVWFELAVAAIRIPPPRFIRPYMREVGWRFARDLVNPAG